VFNIDVEVDVKGANTVVTESTLLKYAPEDELAPASMVVFGYIYPPTIATTTTTPANNLKKVDVFILVYYIYYW